MPRSPNQLACCSPWPGRSGREKSTQASDKHQVLRCAPRIFPEGAMPRSIDVVHHSDRRTDVHMPYAPGIVVRRGHLVFLSGVTAAPVYHSHPHRDEEFDLPPTMREQAVLAMENLKKTVEAAGCGLGDLGAATRLPPDVAEQRSEERRVGKECRSRWSPYH